MQVVKNLNAKVESSNRQIVGEKFSNDKTIREKDDKITSPQGRNTCRSKLKWFVADYFQSTECKRKKEKKDFGGEGESEREREK